MNMEVMLLGVLVVSTLVGLATEALKKLFDEYGKTYHANMLAGCVALVISLAVGVAYPDTSAATCENYTGREKETSDERF